MDQQEYNDLYATDQIVKAIEENSKILAAMSGKDVAVSGSLKNTNSLLSSIDNKLTALNKSVTNNFKITNDTLTDMYVDVVTGLDTLNQTTSSILTIMSKLSGDSDKITTSVTSKTRKEDVALLNSTIKLIEVIADEKNNKRFDKKATVVAKGIDVLSASLERMLSAFSKIPEAEKAMGRFIDFLDYAGKMVQKSGRAIVQITGSIIAMMAVVAFTDWATIGKFVVTFPLLCSSLAAGVFILSKTTDTANMANIAMFSLGIAALSVALMTFALTDWTAIGKGIIAMSAMALAMQLVTRVLPGKAVTQFSGNVMKFAGAVAILGISMVLMSMIMDSVTLQGLAKGAGVLVVVGAVLWLASKVIQQGAITLGKSMGFIALGLAAIGLSLLVFQELIENLKWETWVMAGATIGAFIAVMWAAGKSNAMTLKGAASIAMAAGAILLLPFAIKQFENISWESLGKMGSSVAGLIAALYGAGANAGMTIAGAAALVIGAASILVLANALNKWPQRDWEDLAKVGVVVTGLVAAMYGAGAMAVMTIAGAGALLIGAGAISVLANAMNKWPFEISLAQYGTMAAGIGLIAGSMAVIGNPLTLPFIIAGIAEAAGLGFALQKLGQGLQEAEKVDMSRAGNAATSIVNWAKDTLKTISSMSLKDMVKAGFGLEPFAKLGTALAAIAVAVNSMASGTWNEYKMVDGKPEIVATHKVGPEEYKAVSQSITALLDGITEPLKEFGAGGGFFTESDTEKGINALAQIGDIVNPMLNVAREMDKLKKVDFSGQAGGFGAQVTALVDGVKGALETMGKGSAWFKDNDAEKGIKIMSKIGEIVNPMIEIAKNAKELQGVNLNAFALNIGRFMSGMSGVFEKMKTLGMSKYYAQINTLNSISTPLSKILSAAAEYGKAENQLPSESKLAKHLGLIQKSFDKLDTKNLDLIVEVARSVDSIANANLNNISKAKSDVAKQLFDKLDQLRKELTTISKNTKPKDVQKNILKLNDNGTWKNEFRLEDETEITLTTIAMQLDQLYGLLASQR